MGDAAVGRREAEGLVLGGRLDQQLPRRSNGLIIQRRDEDGSELVVAFDCYMVQLDPGRFLKEAGGTLCPRRIDSGDAGAVIPL